MIATGFHIHFIVSYDFHVRILADITSKYASFEAVIGYFKYAYILRSIRVLDNIILLL